MIVEFINPFIKATMSVLTTMAGIEPKLNKPQLKNGTKSFGDVTGIIGLVGKSGKGTLAVSFSEECIKRIVSGMLGGAIGDLENDIQDSVGEITNIISGVARAELEQSGYLFDMALPTIISGKGHSIYHVTEYPIIVVPFETEAGPFFLEVSLKTSPK